MKLSNKILIGFFSVIFIYTTLAFAEIRIKGEPRHLDHSNSIAESIPLEGMKYLVLQESLDHRITLSSSDNPRMEIKSKSGDLLSKVGYQLNNDTLILSNIEEKEEHFSLTIYIPSAGFSGFNSTSSYIQMENIQQASFSIIQSGGRLDIDEKIEFEKLNLTLAKNGSINIYDSYIDTVAVDMNNSDLRINSKARRVEGLLTNESSIYINGVMDVQLKRDKNSRMQVF